MNIRAIRVNRGEPAQGQADKDNDEQRFMPEFLIFSVPMFYHPTNHSYVPIFDI